MERETLGRIVREAWVRWAAEQPDPKVSWVTGWDELDTDQREVDMRIGEAVAAYVLDRDRSSIVAAFVTLQQEMLDRQRAELAGLRAVVKGGD